MITKSSLRGKLHSNLTKQSSKKILKLVLFYYFSRLPRRFAPRNDDLISNNT
ncbi:hypothetical protein RFEPED_0681 [Rickettsia felis str. Pedreira]|uniref:Uncharacterized protein n=1 Tax=Rickettsia felis str. Pedreira TaxID=1359196 RepID=A0A0F3MRM4_RICFI|nr:hypothetical protein RFEPED_0681 [Rickettsia felis str. Pedreira]